MTGKLASLLVISTMGGAAGCGGGRPVDHGVPALPAVGATAPADLAQRSATAAGTVEAAAPGARRRVTTLTLRTGPEAPVPTRVAGVPAALTALRAPADRWLALRGALRMLPTTASAPFGRGMRVVSSTMSGNGRYVFCWDWSDKKDAQGNVGPIAMFRPFEGTEERFERLVARDPLARYYALIRGHELWLLDTETDRRQRLGGADVDLEDDSYSESQQESQFPLSTFNRQVAFDPYGTALTYHRDRPERVVLRALGTQQESTFAVPGGWFVWRAEPGDSPGSVRAFLVRSRWEYQQAAPSSAIPSEVAEGLCGTAIAETLEYPGPKNVAYHSDAQGKLRPRGKLVSGTRRTHTFGSDFWIGHGGLRRGTTPVPSPVPCTDDYSPVFLNAQAIGYACDDRLWVHRPAQGELLVHRQPNLTFVRSTASYAHRDAAAVAWAMVRHQHRDPAGSASDATEHHGRIRLDTAAIEYCPVPHIEHEARCNLYADPQFERTPWRAGINRDTFFLFNLADGALYETPVPRRYRGNSDDLDQPQPGLVVAPRHLGFYGIDDYPGWITTSGCILQTLAPKRKLTEGPWRVTCPSVAVPG